MVVLYSAKLVNTADNMKAISAFTQPVIFTLRLSFIFVLLSLQYLLPNYLLDDSCWIHIIPVSHFMRLLTFKGLKMDLLYSPKDIERSRRIKIVSGNRGIYLV